jgi:hypothetical protein
VSTCASTLNELAAWSPGTTAGAGTTLGRNAKAGNGEMTFDRRDTPTRTDKVILLAESMGTLTAGSLVQRRPNRPV